MKKIIFLLTLSIANFSGVTLATDIQQSQQQQNGTKFDKSDILKGLSGLGIDARGASYAELLKSETNKRKVCGKVKELEQQFNSMMGRIQAEQADYESKNSTQLREIISEGIEHALQLLGTEKLNGVFDRIRTVLPPDKYEELEPALLEAVRPQNGRDMLGQMTTMLKGIQSGDFSHFLTLDKIGYDFPPSSLVEKFGARLNGAIRRSDSLFSLLTRIVRELKDTGKRQACSDVLSNLRKIYEINSTKKKYFENNEEKELEDNLSSIFQGMYYAGFESKLRETGYQDITDSFHKLALKATLYVAKLHRDDGQYLLWGLFNSNRLSSIEFFGKDSAYGLFLLGEELAKLLDRVASKTDFSEDLLSDDYDSYCAMIDGYGNSTDSTEEEDSSIAGADSIEVDTSAEGTDLIEEDAPTAVAMLPGGAIRRFMSRSVSPTATVSYCRNESLYEAIEERIRSNFDFLSEDEKLILFKNVRIFLLALRDVIRHHSDETAKKQAIKKALTVLDALNQTVLPIKEATKDVTFDISAEQQQDIAKLKEIAVPKIADFVEKMNHLEDIGNDATPFLNELNSIVESVQNRFLETNKNGFDSIFQLISELDEKLKIEGEKNIGDLNAKIAEVKEQLADMTFRDMFIPLHNQKLDLRFSIPNSTIRDLERRGLIGVRLNLIKDMNLLTQIFKDSMGEKADYIVDLVEYRMSMIKKLSTMIPVPLVMSRVRSLRPDKLGEDMLNECLEMTKKKASLQAEPYQHWVTELSKILPVVKEFDIYRTLERLMSGTDEQASVLFDFNTKDGHFSTKVIREGDTLEDVKYSAIPEPKCRPIPVQLYEFFAAVDSDPRNVEKLAAMLESFSPEVLGYAYFDNGELPRWATISKRLINIRQKGIDDKEKLRMLYALATVDDVMNVEQIQNHIARYVKDPQTTLSTLSQDDFVWNDGYVKELCVPDRMKLFLLFKGNVSSEFQKDLLMSDAELSTEFSKYSLEKEIDASRLYKNLSEGSRYEEKGNAYFIEVFLRALEVVFDREDKCYSQQTDIKSENLICNDLNDDILNKKDNLKFFITDVIEGKVPLRNTVSTSLRTISLLTGKNDFTDIGSIDYLFRTLERRIDEYRKTKAENEGAGDAVTKKAKEKEENSRFEIANLIGALIQGLSHCPPGRALAVHHITSGMVKTDKNVEKVSVEDALKYSIQMCSNYYFNSIFHFVSSSGNRAFNVAESQKIKGIDLGKVGLDYEEIMTRGTILRMFNGDYGLSRYNGSSDTLETTVSNLHLYILGQVGRGNMTVLKVMKDLYNSQDEEVRKYGADYSTGEIGENFYAWASPMEIRGQTAQIHMPGIDDYTPTSASQKKLLRALIDEPMQNIHNVTEYVSGDSCDFIWNIVEAKLTASEDEADAVLKTKEMVLDATDDSGEKYENYLNKRIAFYLLKKHNLLKAKSQNNNN